MRTLLIFTALFMQMLMPLIADSQTIKSGNDLWCMEFLDEYTGLTYGDGGLIKQTTDGGTTWIDKVSNTASTLKKSTIITDDNIVVVGLNGTIIKSTDLGETWIEKSSGVINDLYGISFGGRSSEVGISVGSNGTVLRTTDQGETWVTVLTGGDKQKSVNFKAVTLSSESKGILAGDNGIILITSDGGLSWYRCSSDIPRINFKFAISLSENITFITGDNGTILETTDAGESWFALNTGVTSTIYRIRFADDQTAIAVGSQGTIIRTMDGGESWESESAPTANNLYCLFVVNSMTSYTGGESGVIMKTTDGGITWDADKDPLQDPLKDIYAGSNIKLSAYPNPSNPVTKISYKLNQNADIKIKIYDIDGREVETLANSFQETGNYSVIFNGTGLSSGIYFCRITVQTNNSITAKTMKIILVK